MSKVSDQDKAKAWRRLWLIAAPLWVLSMWAAYRFGFAPVAALGGLIVVATLLYQRLINKRAWQSILWGVHASKE